MRGALSRWSWRMLLLHLICFQSGAATAAAQTPAAPVVRDVRIEQEGRVLTDPAIAALIETTVGNPLDLRQVRESIAHLSSLNRYDDVQVYREDVADGVRVRYVLVPSHPVDRVEFRGMLGLSRDDLQRVVRDRFGVAPPARRADEVARVLRDTYRMRGYPDARLAVSIEETHNPDRASMVFDIQAGMRVTIANVTIDQQDQTPANIAVGVPDVRVGQVYDAERVERELARYATAMRERGYLEAWASHSAEFTPRGADVTVQVSRGPRVTIAFAGDPIPEGDRERLVPIRTEASVSQDILEDSQNAIANYLRARGYRDATVQFSPREEGDQLTLTFTVRQGPRYVIDSVVVSGNRALPDADVLDALRLEPGDPFVQSALDNGVGAIRAIYRSRGFAAAQVTPAVTVLPNTSPEDVERHVRVTAPIVEGPRTVVRSVVFRGNMAISDADLLRTLRSTPGRPYTEADVVGDRDTLELDYRNRGYENVVVTPATMLAEGNTQADVTFTIVEGQQIFVDHVIVNGNTRTSAQTILREVTLKPGDPMGYSAVIESQQRLSALGLFRRVRLTQVQHGGNPRRDLLVTVEEAPPTTLNWGGGLQLGSSLRKGAAGAAEERYEFVPRGSFEIGRRNLWGKNRSINLFTRVAVPRDLTITEGAIGVGDQQGRNGFNEFRVFATYREPRILNTRADLLLTGILDQARRSSFNFNRREARAELGMRVSQKFSAAGRYSFERTRLFDIIPNENEQPLIDRLFPQVRLSKWSGTVIRDSRQDLLDPAGGTLLTMTTDVAMRALGSEVGFAKTFVEAFAYPRLPVGGRTVLALGGRLGVAHGFRRPRPANAPTDVPGDTADTVEDLPASERFFAGGDTTVRGFSLDRLGNQATITPAGFPTGGNAVLILNAELRMTLRPSIQVVTFVDAGNVYPKANALDLTDLRPSAGFGARLKLPLLQSFPPIRVDFGFNLDRRELVPGRRERQMVLHISLGQAF